MNVEQARLEHIEAIKKAMAATKKHMEVLENIFNKSGADLPSKEMSDEMKECEKHYKRQQKSLREAMAPRLTQKKKNSPRYAF